MVAKLPRLAEALEQIDMQQALSGQNRTIAPIHGNYKRTAELKVDAKKLTLAGGLSSMALTNVSFISRTVSAAASRLPRF